MVLESSCKAHVNDKLTVTGGDAAVQCMVVTLLAWQATGKGRFGASAILMTASMHLCCACEMIEVFETVSHIDIDVGTSWYNQMDIQSSHSKGGVT